MKRFLTILFVFVSIFANAQSHSFQVWTSLGTSADITKKLSLDFEAESRFQQTSATLKQISTEIDAQYALTKPLFIGIGYKFADKYKKNGYFPVHTILATIGYKKKFGDFRIGIQSKFNFEKNTYTKSSEDLGFECIDKNKIKITYTGIKHLRPSLFVETYHPIEIGSKYHIQTAKYGVTCSYGFRKKIDVDFGYMLRHEVDAQELISIITIGVSKSF